jgi:hypothetical protein
VSGDGGGGGDNGGGGGISAGVGASSITPPIVIPPVIKSDRVIRPRRPCTKGTTLVIMLVVPAAAATGFSLAPSLLASAPTRAVDSQSEANPDIKRTSSWGFALEPASLS